MYGSWEMCMMDAGTDRWMDRWKKWHIVVGAPPKKCWISLTKSKWFFRVLNHWSFWELLGALLLGPHQRFALDPWGGITTPPPPNPLLKSVSPKISRYPPMEHLSNDHNNHPNQHKNSHILYNETGHPIVSLMKSQWKQHDQNFPMEGKPF